MPFGSDESLTIPNGCRIYLLVVGDFGHNADLDELGYYKLAKFVAEHNGYVHYAWWNNLLKEYMGGPLHTQTLNSVDCLPRKKILGIERDQVCGPLNVVDSPGIPPTFYSGNAVDDTVGALTSF